MNFEILYDHISEIDSKFEGYLKPGTDPTGEEITINNLILRESIVLYTEWIIGIVLYAGMDTYLFRNCKYNREKKDQIEKNKGKFYLITFLINFVMISVN